MLLFEEVAYDPEVRKIGDAELAATNPGVDACPHRGKEALTEKTDTISAMCGLLSTVTADVDGVRVCRVTCKKCVAHGKATVATNHFLRQCVACCAYSQTLGRIDTDVVSLVPTEQSMSKAIDNMRAMRGDAMAVAFTDTLYEKGLLDAQQAVDMLLEHGLGGEAIGGGGPA